VAAKCALALAGAGCLYALAEIERLRIENSEQKRKIDELSRGEKDLSDYPRPKSELAEIERLRIENSEQKRKIDELSREEKDLSDYPCPKSLVPYIKPGMVNFCVVGVTGSGKTTFVNLSRGLKPDDSRCAPVGHHIEGTLEHGCYPFKQRSDVNIWDMPGYGTSRYPIKTYFKDTGVKHFDFVVIFMADRFREVDRDLTTELRKSDVPFIYVHNKVDQGIQNMMEDEKMSEEDAFDKLRLNVKQNLPEGADVFIVSSRWKNREKYDMPRLMKLIDQKVHEVLMPTLEQNVLPGC
jgi:GTP-binding protein EngB required for normal cell division